MARQMKNIEVIRIYNPDRERMVKALRLILEAPIPTKDIEDISINKKGKEVS